jgi:uncharacterized membrane protein YhhN
MGLPAWAIVAALVSGLLYLVPHGAGLGGLWGPRPSWAGQSGSRGLGSLTASPWWAWVLKPLTTLLILGAAAAGLAEAGRYGWLMLLGLALSLAGDLFLMLPRDRFIPGLASFLAAHIAYTVAFWGRSPAFPAWGWAVAAVLAIIGLFIYRRFVPALRAKGTVMLIAVALYVTAILLMSLRGLLTGDPVIAAGALLFLLSDAILGWNRFAAPVPSAQVWIMVSYWMGQALLALSVTR